jgi:hypothetical protein
MLNNDVRSGIAPEGMPLPSVRNLGPWAVGIIMTILMSGFGGYLHSQVRRVEAKLDAAVAAVPPSVIKGCPCCLKTK